MTDPAGGRWFVTVDDVSAPGAFDLLAAALGTALELRRGGAEFVVAPVPTAGGRPAVRLGERYAVSLFPLVDGEAFDFGEYADGDHRSAVLAMVVRVHSAPATARRRATADDLALTCREALEAALTGRFTDCGPYAERTADLLSGHAGKIRERLTRYDRLVAGVDPARAVLTHGEPHPGNTMRTKDGWRLIDWETARLAPPERDLWLLGGDLRAYTAITGVEVRPELLELFELRWRLTDLALDAERFRRPHGDDPNERRSFEILSDVAAGI